jgi:hypothetical protein
MLAGSGRDVGIQYLARMLEVSLAISVSGYLAIRTLLRLAEGIEGDPAVRDYSALVAAHERHRAELLGQRVHADPLDAAAAIMGAQPRQVIGLVRAMAGRSH